MYACVCVCVCVYTHTPTHPHTHINLYRWLTASGDMPCGRPRSKLGTPVPAVSAALPAAPVTAPVQQYIYAYTDTHI